MKPVLGLALVLISAPIVAGPSDAVDRTYVTKADVIGSKRHQTITLHIVGESLHSAFRWTVKLTTADGVTLYDALRDDTAIDKFFSEDGFVVGCNGYEACKRKYYFDLLPGEVANAAKAKSSSWFSWKDAELHFVEGASGDLKQKGFSESQIKALIDEMRGILSTPGHYTLDIPIGPDDGDHLVWVPSIRQFVRYYVP